MNRLAEELPMNYQRLEAALQPPKVYRDEWHERYHGEQASRVDTALKRLARALGDRTVRCPCGHEFPV